MRLFPICLSSSQNQMPMLIILSNHVNVLIQHFILQTQHKLNRFKTLENADQLKTLIDFNQTLIEIEYQHNKLTSPYSKLATRIIKSAFNAIRHWIFQRLLFWLFTTHLLWHYTLWIYNSAGIPPQDSNADYNYSLIFN